MLWYHLQRLLIWGWLLLVVAFGFALREAWLQPNLAIGCGVKEVGFCGVYNPLDSLARTGKTLFRNNCASCHAGNMKSNLTGPALGGAQERWAAHGGDTLLYAFIRNSQAMITEGKNDRANELWEEWGPTVMNSFTKLTDEEIEAMLAYIEAIYR